jgi:hypothetical protein
MYVEMLSEGKWGPKYHPISYSFQLLVHVHDLGDNVENQGISALLWKWSTPEFPSA